MERACGAACGMRCTCEGFLRLEAGAAAGCEGWLLLKTSLLPLSTAVESRSPSAMARERGGKPAQRWWEEGEGHSSPSAARRSHSLAPEASESRVRPRSLCTLSSIQQKKENGLKEN